MFKNIIKIKTIVFQFHSTVIILRYRTFSIKLNYTYIYIIKYKTLKVTNNQKKMKLPKFINKKNNKKKSCYKYENLKAFTGDKLFLSEGIFSTSCSCKKKRNVIL